MPHPAESLGPSAKAVYAALAEPGTEADVAGRTGINAKTVGARIGEHLIKQGLVEAVGQVRNERGRKVNVYGHVPLERVEAARAQAHDRTRVKPARERPFEVRKKIARELLKDRDVLESLAADRAADRQTTRMRKLAREELRERERQAAELRRNEKHAASAQDPRLPFWRALRELSQGADAARILKMMLDRDVQLAATRDEPLVDAAHWSDGIRHTTDMLQVAGVLHNALHIAFGASRMPCPACGADPPAPVEDDWDVVEGEVIEELAELVSGDD